jgi:hypothetical protein
VQAEHSTERGGVGKPFPLISRLPRGDPTTDRTARGTCPLCHWGSKATTRHGGTWRGAAPVAARRTSWQRSGSGCPGFDSVTRCSRDRGGSEQDVRRGDRRAVRSGPGCPWAAVARRKEPRSAYPRACARWQGRKLPVGKKCGTRRRRLIPTFPTTTALIPCQRENLNLPDAGMKSSNG